ncbi:tobamovirus multiplication protein 2A [Abrus precatorius]|uniref:Tobamovirus multiplication protein 2A n=1 Tax=Abrus precatorius TaxID=3816 RepID=A0A8B8JVB4_ABRPR|nr:tobamovirus multiplication protein 2A [Abrus precatorius]XP_027334567.1 tobamovirus multiplication protein 2A [Abrus precatorius]XP_027334568.1 tobamovirus multiplication protein 2A [Abrus precatorius]XP_027334569.1 tobamovirus multiplication protein 2A [Abrus precatorius]XP_027334570.1 tobamovirus multiplication protein 2A [Abrus precatorius]XP_027334571.1 tobamovirus multiplication protein 2A [Abrus precatorius]
MACRGCWECLLKLLNFIMTLVGLAMVGYGIYLLVEYNQAPDNTLTVSTVSDDQTLVQLGRPMLMAVSLSNNFFDDLPKAWFIYVFIGIGVILFIISCFGCIGAVTRNGCCLSFYSVLVLLLILVELGCAAFIFFDKSWKEEIPKDKTGAFDMIYGFLRENWKIVQWVALGIVIFEALLFVLALIVRAANKPPEYDSDEEYINPRQQTRQPLLNRPAGPASGVPVAGTGDQRPSRNDAWSTRMREKYGLDTSEFTYNPSESHRFQQVNSQPPEERSRCTIM